MQEIKFAKERPTGADGRDTIEVPIDGKIYFAYRPTTNSIALFYSSIGRNKMSSALVGVENFLKKNVEPECFTLLMEAVEKDQLEYEDLMTLVQEIIQEFSENPTSPSKESTSSRAGTGTKSTVNSRRPASTRDSSRRSVSSD